MKTIRPSSPACYINHILLLGATKNITCGDNLYVNAGMKFYLHDEAKIIIGNNVTFYSQNDDYHMNMFAGVKIIADRPGAVTEICGNTRVNGSCIHAWDSVKIGKKLSYCC